MRKFFEWLGKVAAVALTLALLAAAAALAIDLLVVGLMKVLPQDKDKSQTLAAWVQAIGSIAAILGAFCLAYWQDRLAGQREQKRQAESEKAFGTYAIRLFSETLDDANRLRSYLHQEYPRTNPDEIQRAAKLMEKHVEAIDRFDMGRLNLEGILAFEELRMAVKDMVLLFKGGSYGPDVIEAVDKAFEFAIQELGRFKTKSNSLA